MKRQYQRVDWKNGLHLVNKSMVQLKHCEKHAADLNEDLETAVKATKAKAPVRRNPYALQRPDHRELHRRGDGIPESFWEQGAWESRSRFLRSPDDRMPFVAMQSYQVMLRDRNDKENAGWGEIDLLGVSRNKLPVVIELKTEPSQIILFAMVEALAYGLAIRKAWEKVLRHQWAEVVKAEMPPSLGRMELVCAGPMRYWQDIGILVGSDTDAWKPRSPEYFGQLKVLQQKLKAMDDGGYAITFVGLEQNGCTPFGYPVITGTQVVEIP